MPEMAKKVTIDRKHSKVYVDGVEFPWHIAEQGPDVESAAAHRGAPTVHIPVLTRDVEIIPASD